MTINLRDEAFAAHLQQRFKLNSRELEVALLVADGANRKRAARAVGRSIDTVIGQAKTMRKKLGAQDRFHACGIIHHTYHEWFLDQRGISA